MTRCILPTDIELAKKLLTARRPDDAIVTALVHRGIESSGAAQLVADLRSGRPVAPQIPDGLAISPRRRSRSRRASSESEPQQPSRVSEPDRRREGPLEPKAEPKHTSTVWLIAAIPVCFVAVTIGVLISNHRHRTADDAAATKAQPAASAGGAAAVAAPDATVPHASASAQTTVAKPEAAPAAGVTNASKPQLH